MAVTAFQIVELCVERKRGGSSGAIDCVGVGGAWASFLALCWVSLRLFSVGLACKERYADGEITYSGQDVGPKRVFQVGVMHVGEFVPPRPMRAPGGG